MFAGAGSGPLMMAASAWDGLASDLSGAASSFESVVSGLASAAWTGPSSLSMAAAAAPYVGWLSAAAGQAEAAASQARAAATAFETAQATTVLPGAVTANRVSLMTLIATNFLGQNTPAIAMNELEYLEMWAQDVGAMLGYHAGATSVASLLPSFSVPPVSSAGLGQLVTSAMSSVSGLLPVGGLAGLANELQTAVSAIPSAVSQVSSLVSSTPLSSLTSVAQIGMYPVSMMMSPMMMLAQGAGHAAPAVAGAEFASDAPKFAGAAVPEMKAMGGAGLGSAMSAGLGKARLVGAMSDMARVNAGSDGEFGDVGVGRRSADRCWGGGWGPYGWYADDADADGWYGRQRRDVGPRWGESDACGAVSAQCGAAHRGRLGLANRRKQHGQTDSAVGSSWA